MGETNINTVETIQIRIAERVRGDSRDFSRPVSSRSINLLLTEFETDDATINFVDMQRDKKFADIKSVVSSSGTVYLYSITYIAESQALELANNEDRKTIIAKTVRDKSKDDSRLTSALSLAPIFPEMKIEIVNNQLSELTSDKRLLDIKTVLTSAGAMYLYSDKYITRNYAKILVRAEENDPCTTIAETVRDEAKIYPRPTNIEFLLNPIFNIESKDIETQVAKTMEKSEFKDIKLISASTGARYLFSDLYMSEAYARSLVEWEEVDKYENP